MNVLERLDKLEIRVDELEKSLAATQIALGTMKDGTTTDGWDSEPQGYESYQVIGAYHQAKKNKSPTYFWTGDSWSKNVDDAYSYYSNKVQGVMSDLEKKKPSKVYKLTTITL